MTPATYCTSCGNALPDGARFCVKCGAPRPAPRAASAAPAATPAPTHGAAPIAADALGMARQAAGTAGTVASVAGGLSLPWQTITAGQTPDLRALIAAGAPLAQRAVLASLRRPAIALLVTTALDVTVALVTQQPGAMRTVWLRAAMGVATAVLGLIAGSKAGPLRQATGIASALTGVVQTGAMLVTLFSSALSPVRLLGTVPALISQASSLTMLVKTALVSFSGTKRRSPAPAENPAN